MSLRAAILFVLLLAGAVGWIVWATRPEPVPVTVARVDRGTVERTVSNTRAGTVRACRRAGLSPSSGGQIARLPVREGQHVRRGTLLLELWNEDLKAKLAVARARVAVQRAKAEAACVRAEVARREAERIHRLYRNKLASEEQRDKAESGARAATAECDGGRAAVTLAEAERQAAEAALARTRLTAPFDGVVARVRGELAEFVTPSPIGIPTPPVVDLIDTSCFYVSAPIDEVDAPGLRTGLPVRITLDAFRGETFEGSVRRVADFVLDLEKQARTVEVEVAFEREADRRRLLAGYSADVEIVLAVREGVLRVPTEAVVREDRVWVFDSKAGVLRERRFVPGLSNWDWTEVRSGLRAGTLVVTSVERKGITDGARAVIGPAGDD